MTAARLITLLFHFQRRQIFAQLPAIFLVLLSLNIHNVYVLLGINLMMNSLFHGTVRIFYASIFAWIIFECHSGRGGALNTFLSWRGWMPIAKLSFCIYLIGPVLQFDLNNYHKHQLNLDMSNMVSST